MNTDRRNFIKATLLLTATLFLPVKSAAVTIIEKASLIYNVYLQKVVDIINTLNKEDSSLVLKAMDGKDYVFDPYFHYPVQGGIVDEESRSRVFFHCHRENEYGHFHTFIEDDDGELVHLVLISMDERGTPLSISTVNTWVTGDKYVKAEKLKELLDKFTIDPNLFKDERLLEFINDILLAYKNEIHKLFVEREEWVRNYAFTYTREPFDDHEHEILSTIEIDVFEDLKT